jgi:hypothetical protein
LFTVHPLSVCVCGQTALEPSFRHGPTRTNSDESFALTKKQDCAPPSSTCPCVSVAKQPLNLLLATDSHRQKQTNLLCITSGSKAVVYRPAPVRVRLWPIQLLTPRATRHALLWFNPFYPWKHTSKAFLRPYFQGLFNDIKQLVGSDPGSPKV